MPTRNETALSVFIWYRDMLLLEIRSVNLGVGKLSGDERK